MKALGYLPDAPDGRDRLFSAHPKAAISLPASVSLWDPRCSTMDQRHRSSCVGRAFGQGLRLAYLFAGADCPELSAEFLYYLSRAEHAGEHEDSGTYLRTCAAALKKFGAADETSWSSEDDHFDRQPNMRALHSAYDRKGLKGYWRIPAGDVDGIRKALASGCPVVAGWQVSQSFLDWNGVEPVGDQLYNIVGGHALVLYGYRADGTFEGVNSWGVTWNSAMGGHFLASEVFAARATDVWALDVTP